MPQPLSISLIPAGNTSLHTEREREEELKERRKVEVEEKEQQLIY